MNENHKFAVKVDKYNRGGVYQFAKEQGFDLLVTLERTNYLLFFHETNPKEVGWLMDGYVPWLKERSYLILDAGKDWPEIQRRIAEPVKPKSPEPITLDRVEYALQGDVTLKVRFGGVYFFIRKDHIVEVMQHFGWLKDGKIVA